MTYGAADVARAAGELLDARVIGDAVRIERGFGNENWRLATSSGDVVVKVGLPDADVAKWTAATLGATRAEEAGVPVAAPLAFTPVCETVDGRVVRIIEFVDGVHPQSLADDPPALRRFFAEFGTALARLHGVQWHAFSSRLDGSAPEFASWAEYVQHRLPHIERRAQGVFTDREFARLATIVREAVAVVSPVVAPSLTHRDLFFDNLLVRRDGSIVAILDWDAAEAWDCAIDLVKPRSQMFGAAPDEAEAFWDAYPALDHLTERLLAVDLLEHANAVANARKTADTAFEQRCRGWLDAALASA